MRFWSPETSILSPNYHSPQLRGRKWPSLYEALDDCRPNRHKLMKLYLRAIPTSRKRPIIAGDHTPPKMKLSDSTTWGIPVESIEIDDPSGGRVEIKRWSQFHFYHSPDHPMEIILIQRQGKGLSKKAAKP